MSSLARHGCLAALVAAAFAAHAGTVDVSYDASAPFADAGRTQSEREDNLAALTAYLQGLGARLPGAGRQLRVRLLDVDLAGTVRPVGRTGQEMRIVRGGADWPRIKLRYTLLEDGREVRSGEEWLADLGYQTRQPGYGSETGDALRYEKRLLADWFDARFVTAGGAPQ